MYSIGPSSYCNNSLNFWSSCLHKNSPISQCPSLEFIKILIQNLFDFLSPSQQQKFRDTHPIDQNLSIWIALGLKRAEHDETESNRIRLYNDLCTKIDEHVLKCTNCPSVNNYESLVMLYKIQTPNFYNFYISGKFVTAVCNTSYY